MVLEQAKPRAEAGDIDGAIECFEGHQDVDQVMKAYEDLVLHMYWERKNIHAVVTLAHAGIQRMLREADAYGAANPEKRLNARQRARVMAYNLASFCWAGWDEPGIELRESEKKAGRDAAVLHYELVQSLNPEAITSARAAWIVGAQLLTAHEYAAARSKFEESSEHAQQANSEAEHLLGLAFAHLAKCLESTDDSACRAELQETKQRLLRAKDGEEFVRQVDTAEAVCRRGQEASIN